MLFPGKKLQVLRPRFWQRFLSFSDLLQTPRFVFNFIILFLHLFRVLIIRSYRSLYKTSGILAQFHVILSAPRNRAASKMSRWRSLPWLSKLKSHLLRGVGGGRLCLLADWQNWVANTFWLFYSQDNSLCHQYFRTLLRTLQSQTLQGMLGFQTPAQSHQAGHMVEHGAWSVCFQEWIWNLIHSLPWFSSRSILVKWEMSVLGNYVLFSKFDP